MKQYSLIEWRIEKQWNRPASQFDFTSTPIWLFNYAEVTIQRSNNVQMSNWFTGKYSQLKNEFYGNHATYGPKVLIACSMKE